MHGRLRLNYSMWSCFLENGFSRKHSGVKYSFNLWVVPVVCKDMNADGTPSIKTTNDSSQSNVTVIQTSANMLRMRRFTFPHQSQNLNVCKIYNSFIEQHPQTSLTHITLPLCTAVQCELIYNTLQYKYKTHQIQVVGRWGRQQ